MPERAYLFLDCDDIRRIREQLDDGPLEVLADWRNLRAQVDEYRGRFPTDYRPEASGGALWWGPGNYVARDMALTYLVTGETDYASDILRLLELVRSNTPDYRHLIDYGSPMGDGLESAGGLLSAPWYGAVVYQSLLFAYLSIQDTNLLTEEQRALYDDFFINQARLLEEAVGLEGWIDIASWRNRNVPHAANTAAVTIALAFPEDPSAAAVFARMWPALQQRIAQWWERDGGWGENTDSYGYRELEGLLLLAETFRHAQREDIYSTDFQGQTIHSMCTYFLRVVTPEGTSPAINESNFLFVDPGLLDLCGVRTQDRELEFAADQYQWGYLHAYGRDNSDQFSLFHTIAWAGLAADGAPAPNYTSTLLPDTGVGILRSGWKHTDQYLLLQFSSSRVHQEHSFAAVYLYDHGPWIVGNGYQPPEDMPTDQHSTLSVDHQNQTRTGGQLAAFSHLGTVGIAAVTSQTYPGIQHTRTVLWAEPLHQWTVVDDVRQLGENTFHTLQQRWYVWGWAADHADGLWLFGRRGTTDSLSIDMLPGSLATYTPITRRCDWEHWICNATGVEVGVPFSSAAARLITVLTTYGPTPEVRATRIDDAGGTMVETTQGGLSWTWILPPVARAQGLIADATVRGHAGCLITTPESLQGYCLLSGTFLESGDTPLVASERTTSVEADFSQDLIIAEVDLSGTISLHWPDPVSSITDSNGASLQFQTENQTVSITLPEGRSELLLR